MFCVLNQIPVSFGEVGIYDEGVMLAFEEQINELFLH